MLVRDYLHQLAGAAVATSPGNATRSEHLERLARQAQSDLEREWLELLAAGGHRLPDRAQVLLEDAGTRPDFVYDDAHVAIYIDGPHHLYPERAARDGAAEDQLFVRGWSVLRFSASDDWPALIARHTSTFGGGTR
jgi:very-short-patch-repair endonuclease